MRARGAALVTGVTGVMVLERAVAVRARATSLVERRAAISRSVYVQRSALWLRAGGEPARLDHGPIVPVTTLSSGNRNGTLTHFAAPCIAPKGHASASLVFWNAHMTAT
jgi:hypothetical protein